MDSPLYGYGIGAAVNLAGLPGSGGVYTLDNYFLTVALESGLPALFAFAMIFVLPMWIAFKYVTTYEANDSAFLAGAFGAVASLFAVRAVLSIPYNLTILFLLAGMMVAFANRENAAQAKETSQARG
jgi:O-antigen ligase